VLAFLSVTLFDEYICTTRLPIFPISVSFQSGHCHAYQNVDVRLLVTLSFLTFGLHEFLTSLGARNIG